MIISFNREISSYNALLFFFRDEIFFLSDEVFSLRSDNGDIESIYTAEIATEVLKEILEMKYEDEKVKLTI